MVTIDEPYPFVLHTPARSARVLGAVLFGLIMVLIITLGAHSLVKEGRDATRDMLATVVGCNVAWGASFR